MNVTITPAKLSGAVTPPPSKSQAHRLLIAAALAHGESVITNMAFPDDIRATLRCLEELGAGFAVDGSTVTVQGMGANAMSPMRRMAYPRLDCGESGSTLRFLIPIALAVRGGGTPHAGLRSARLRGAASEGCLRYAACAAFCAVRACLRLKWFFRSYCSSFPGIK